MPLGVIIVAAGSSRRMGFNKLEYSLAGSSVLQHSVATFLSISHVDRVVVVSTNTLFKSLEPHSKLVHAQGGSERHLSVAAGLSAIDSNCDQIAIHDGARPLVTQEQILKVWEAAKIYGAAASAHQITDTVKRSDKQHFATESIDREHLWAMETPQIFSTKLIKEAYSEILKSETLVTDEVSAVEYIGTATKLVNNTSPNIKITFPADIQLAESLLIQFKNKH